MDVDTKEAINLCQVYPKILTDWEWKFVEDMARRIDQGQEEFTSKQHMHIERIYNKCKRRHEQ